MRQPAQRLLLDARQMRRQFGQQVDLQAHRQAHELAGERRMALALGQRLAQRRAARRRAGRCSSARTTTTRRRGRRAASTPTDERQRSRRRAPSGPARQATPAAPVKRRAQAPHQHRQAHRLGDVVDGAELHRLDHLGLDRAGRDHHHLRRLEHAGLGELPQQRQAVEPGQAELEHEQPGAHRRLGAGQQRRAPRGRRRSCGRGGRGSRARVRPARQTARRRRRRSRRPSTRRAAASARLAASTRLPPWRWAVASAASAARTSVGAVGAVGAHLGDAGAERRADRRRGPAPSTVCSRKLSSSSAMRCTPSSDFMPKAATTKRPGADVRDDVLVAEGPAEPPAEQRRSRSAVSSSWPAAIARSCRPPRPPPPPAAWL